MHETLVRLLEDALGPDAIAYAGASPASGPSYSSLTVTPADEEGVAAVVRLCRERGVPLVPVGGGTLMEVGYPPLPQAVRVSLTGMAAIREHDDANLTVTAEAGVTVTALRRHLRVADQFAALDVAFPDRATLGGVVAVNINGFRRAGYRAIRDLVIGIRAVTGKGDVIKGGGKVVKNVAGYDMCKLFVGSLGTLGIITQVTARVEPLPESDVTLVVACPDLTAALATARAVAEPPLLPTALAAITAAPARRLVGASGPAVLIRLEGFERGVARQEQEVATRARGDIRRVPAPESSSLWAALARWGWEGEESLVRLTVPRAEIGDVVAIADAAAAPTEIVADLPGQAVWILIPPGVEAQRCLSALTDLALARGGHFMIARAPGREGEAGRPDDGERWGPLPPGLSLMRTLKEQYDPDGILNAGRFLSRI